MADGGYTSGAPIELRPPRQEDAPAISALVHAAFPDPPNRPPQALLARVRHIIEHSDEETSLTAIDPQSGGLLGSALAIRRGDFWGLSMLYVDPGAQGRGLGRRLLERVPPATPGLQRAIMSSTDPRAMRRYASLGLQLQPTVSACEVLRPKAVSWPRNARELSGAEAAELLNSLATAARGAPYGPDAATFLNEDRFVAVGEEAICAVGGGVVHALHATTENAARSALQGALATIEPGTTAYVSDLRGNQQWAIQTVLEARLALSPDGPAFSDRPLSSLHLPNPALF
jgi:GNAT superfamily N-acetyltransferase